MRQEAVELLLHSLAVVGYAITATLFAGLGLLFEYKSYLLLTGDDPLLAAWTAGVGLIMFGFFYLVVTTKLVRRYTTA